MKFDSTTYTFTDKGNTGKIALIVGVIGLAVSLVGLFVNAGQFYFSWLIAFAFWISIGLGGLFMTMVHHLTSAVWSVAVRRIGEAVMSALPWMTLLAIPLLFGLDKLFIWTDANHVAADVALTKKAGYLSVPFFIVRSVIYFAVWALLAFLLKRTSLAQDKQWTEERAKKFVVISGPGMIAFALTATFFCFDWIMSLQPLWYSTIYGLWFFAGGITTVMAFYSIVVLRLRNNNVLSETITVEHQHDIGKLLFAFLVFWGYMHLSQYLLIWYANLPEETAFYKDRWGAGWTTMSWILIIGGFVIPFILLMGRSAKRSSASLITFAVWMFLVHWVDLYWNIMPVFHTETVVLSWMDLTTLLGMGGIFVWLFWMNFTKHPAVPITDPKLDASIKMVN